MHTLADGAPGLFTTSVMMEVEGDEDWAVVQSPVRQPSRPHLLSDQSLVLHTSGTSGKKKASHFLIEIKHL